MLKRFVAVLAFAAAVLAGPAAAETVQVPATGAPAFVVDFPDGWTHYLDANGSLISVAPDHSASITFTITPYSGALDTLAAEAVPGPNGEAPRDVGEAEISGYHGRAYDSLMINKAGVRVNVHLVIVRLDDGHIAGLNLLTPEDTDNDHYTAAKAVFDSVTITGH